MINFDIFIGIILIIEFINFLDILFINDERGILEFNNSDKNTLFSFINDI